MGCSGWCTVTPTDPANERDDPESELVEWEVELSAFSTWFINEVLNVFDRSDAPEIPTQFYVALHSSTCSALEAGTEVSTGGYERQAVSFEKVSDLRRWSSADVSFPTATAAYSVASLSLWDSDTGGNYYAYGNLIQAVTVGVGSSLKLPANRVIVEMA